MKTTSSLVVDRLADMGIQRPAPALVIALDAYVAPRVAALIARALTKRVVAQAFAATLVVGERKGSPEGMRASASLLASSPEASSCSQQDKPEGVAGASGNGEAA